MTEPIYHYCSAEAFHAIVTSNTIRLSMLDMSNDSAEGSWLIQQVMEQVAKDGRVSAAADLISRTFEVSARDRVAAGFCMSGEPDLLSQWRGYADNGAGFSIGFDPIQLREAIARKHHVLSDTQLDINLVKVEYSMENLAPTISAFFDEVVATTDDYRKQLADDQREIKGLEHYVRLQISMQFASGALDERRHWVKNPAFKEEAEWRVIANIPKDTNEGGFESGVIDHIEFGASRGRIIPFLTIPLEPESICDVRLGPRNTTGVFYTEALLSKSFQRYIPVTPSVATYR